MSKLKRFELFEKEYKLIKRIVQAKNYVLMNHAFEEMIVDGLHVKDIEHIIFSGAVIRNICNVL